MIDIEFLRTIPMFSTLPAHELQAMAELWLPLCKEENQTIFKKGDSGSAIYLIQEGTIQIHITADNGDDILLSELHRGEVFGELTLFDNAPRTATAIAIEHTQLFYMPRDAFINFLTFYPQMAITLLGILGKHIRNTNTMMQHLTTRNANDQIEHQLTFGERTADKVAEFVGSWKFIIVFLIMMAAWMAVNFFVLIIKPVDPYPFILLNLILSCIAAIQAPVIMMSQGRQAKKDRIAADLDYQINLKSELQIQQILVKLDKINTLEVKKFQELKRMQKDLLRKEHELEALIQQDKKNNHNNQIS